MLPIVPSASRFGLQKLRLSAVSTSLASLALLLLAGMVGPSTAVAEAENARPVPHLLVDWRADNDRLTGRLADGAEALRCDCAAKGKGKGAKADASSGFDGADMAETMVWIDGAEVGAGICRAVEKSGEFSLLVVVSDVAAEQAAAARIVSMSSNRSERNFSLVQHGNRFGWRVRTRDSDANGEQKRSEFGRFSPSGKEQEILISCRGETATCFIDGKMVGRIKLAGPLANWQARHHLLFGDEFTRDRNWSGKLQRVAIFDAAVDPEQARRLLEERHCGTKREEDIDKVRRDDLADLRADVSSLRAAIAASRRDGGSLDRRLAESDRHGAQLQRQLEDLLRQKERGNAELVELSRQFALAMEELNDSSQARLLDQQRKFEEEMRRVRSENERIRADFSEMRRRFEAQLDEMKLALQEANRARAEAEETAMRAQVEQHRLMLKKTFDATAILPEPSKARPLRLSVLCYEKNVAVAAQAEMRALGEMKNVLAAHPQVQFDIVGHTCSYGSSRANLRLSIQRAENLRDFLVANGVPPEILHVRGMGESAPIADNATPAGRAKNRRVEILFRK